MLGDILTPTKLMLLIPVMIASSCGIGFTARWWYLAIQRMALVAGFVVAAVLMVMWPGLPEDVGPLWLHMLWMTAAMTGALKLIALSGEPGPLCDAPAQWLATRRNQGSVVRQATTPIIEYDVEDNDARTIKPFDWADYDIEYADAVIDGLPGLSGG